METAVSQLHQRAGSVDRGNGSDIDLTIIGDTLSQSRLLQLENQLDDLLLPYKIDLSLLHRIESRELLDHITRIGVTFWTPDVELSPPTTVPT